jgi:hypothetical protein
MSRPNAKTRARRPQNAAALGSRRRGEPYYGGFFRDVARRLDELAAKCGMKSMGLPPAIFVPADFRRHVENLGFAVEEITEWFDPERSLVLAAEIVRSRRCYSPRRWWRR